MVDAQSASEPQPSGLPLVLGVTQVFHETSNSRLMIADVDGLGIFLHGCGCFVRMLPAVEEALDRRRHERADEIGIALDQILMHDDAIGRPR